MICHLLQDNHERGDKILEVVRSLLYLIEVVVQRCSHDRRVAIAQSPLHVSVEALYLLLLVEADEDHDGLFPNHLLLMLHEGEHYILNGSNHAHMGQLADDVKSSHHFKMVLGLQIFLHCGDEKDEDVTTLVNEKGTCQVTDSLDQNVFALSQVNGMNVRKARVMTKHFDVDGTN